MEAKPTHYCALFIDENSRLPGWLVIRDMDDLKGNLLSVIIVVLCVRFVANSFTAFLQLHKTLLTTPPYNGIVNTNRYASQP